MYMWFMELMKFVKKHGRSGLVGYYYLIAQQQEYLIDPLRTSHVIYKELNLGKEDNNHSSQLPKLHPIN
jgi:hypothetical protein